MKQANTKTFLRQTLDERQLAILVGLCVAACREVLRTPSTAQYIPSAPRMQPSHAEFGQSGRRATEISNIGHTHLSGVTSTGTDPVHARGNQPQSSHAPAAEPKLLLTVEEAAQRLSIGRPKMWQLVMRGEVLSVKIGASRRVPTTALVDYVRRFSGELVQTPEAPDRLNGLDGHEGNGGPGGQHDEHDVTTAGLDRLSYRANSAFGAYGPHGLHEAQARTGHVRVEAQRAERANEATRKEEAA